MSKCENNISNIVWKNINFMLWNMPDWQAPVHPTAGITRDPLGLNKYQQLK